MGKKKLKRKLSKTVQTAFETALSKSSFEVLSAEGVADDGIEYRLSLYDPFSGTVRGNYFFSWNEIVAVISNGVDSALHEEISMEISEWAEVEGHGEFVLDDDGRVHSRSNMPEQ